MNLQTISKHLNEIKQGLNEYLSTNCTSSESYTFTKRLSDNLENLIVFLGDQKTIAVLEKNGLKDFDQSPLGSICKPLSERLKNIAAYLDNFVQTDVIKSEYLQSISFYQNIDRYLNEAALERMVSVIDVLKHLDGHSKTLIVLGPNGSGKTSFANHLKNYDSHIKVIPADKPIKASGYIPSIYNTSLDGFNQELYNPRNESLSADILQKLIIGLCSQHDNVARKYLDTGEKGDSTYQKIKEIFEMFFDVKLDNSAFANKEIMAKKGDLEPFKFNNMSDGERVGFFYIATVISAPEKSFVIVDEPENHLNPAIYNKIWDKLLDLRSDCQFIFISHTVDFINARTNYELATIKNYSYPNSFEFEFLGEDINDISPNLIVEIVGSRKPILFCEGGRNDYDYKIYEKLFGEKYTVIPTGNCSTVINSVSTCNLHASRYTVQSAIGIIDSDLKSNDEINCLKNKKVFVLKCNEIEMLLLDEIIFKKALLHVYKNESEFDQFKKEFFEKLKTRKTFIVKRLVKTQIEEILRKSVIDDNRNETKEMISSNLRQIYESIDVEDLWNKSTRIIDEFISKSDYDAALSYCCLEHNEILKGIGCQFVHDYSTIALGLLENDTVLKAYIRQKYFPEVVL